MIVLKKNQELLCKLLLASPGVKAWRQALVSPAKLNSTHSPATLGPVSEGADSGLEGTHFADGFADRHGL